MLISFSERGLVILSSIIFANLIYNNKSKWKLIISGVIVFLIISMMFIKDIGIFDNNSKLENVTREYVKNLGYDIAMNEQVYISNFIGRNGPITVFMIILNPEGDWIKLELIYNRSKITDSRIIS